MSRTNATGSPQLYPSDHIRNVLVQTSMLPSESRRGGKQFDDTAEALRSRVGPMSRTGQTDEFWTAGIDERTYVGDGRAAYQEAVMEQYKLYVDLVQSNRARRSTANSFFLGLNTSVFVAVGALWHSGPLPGDRAVLLLPLMVLLTQCLAWVGTVQRHRQIGERHWLAVRRLEERLPAAASLWQDSPGRLPLTQIEMIVPGLFAIAYVLLFAVAAVAGGR